MMKWTALALLMICADALASPGRLQGFTYRRDDNGTMATRPETEDFNTSYDAVSEREPTAPHYLNEDGSDARTGTSKDEDKYTLSPVTPSTRTLYERQAQGAPAAE
jgi:hypothetical protein